MPYVKLESIIYFTAKALFLSVTFLLLSGLHLQGGVYFYGYLKTFYGFPLYWLEVQTSTGNPIAPTLCVPTYTIYWNNFIINLLIWLLPAITILILFPKVKPKTVILTRERHNKNRKKTK